MAVNPLPLLRKLDRLLQLEETHGDAIRRLSVEVAQLKDRVTRLETRDEVLIARAEGAASTAAALAAAASLTDLARRVGAMEERGRQGTLPAPTAPEQRL